MSKPDDESHIPLPEELNRDLRRASERTLSAITSLRKALLEHVQSERRRGTTFPNIKLDLQEVISKLQVGESGTKADSGGQHELATQMIEWADGFYNRKD